MSYAQSACTITSRQEKRREEGGGGGGERERERERERKERERMGSERKMNIVFLPVVTDSARKPGSKRKKPLLSNGAVRIISLVKNKESVTF